MNGNRASIGRMMFLVGWICLNFAVLRWLILERSEVMIPAVLMVVAIQVVLGLLIRGAGRWRWFGLGFVAFGSVWPALFTWLYFLPESPIQESWPMTYLQWSMGEMSGPVMQGLGHPWGISTFTDRRRRSWPSCPNS